MPSCLPSSAPHLMGLAFRLLIGVLVIHLLVPMDVHGYELFQTLSHVETGFESLDEPGAAVLSPDGRHLYVGGLEAILVIERDAVTGTLTTVQTLKSSRDGFDVFLINHLVISPDGLHLYAGSTLSSGLVAFARNPTDGRLTAVQSLYDLDPTGVGLRSLSDLEISPDGEHLFTLSTDQEEVGVFARSSDGSLTLVDSLHSIHVPEIEDPTALATSPDGRQVVVADRLSGLLVFERHAASGALNLVTTFPSGASGVVRPSDLIFSPDGAYLYVSGEDINLQPILSGLRRNAEGTLSRIQTLRGLATEDGLAMDSEGANLYLTTGDQVTVMARSPQGQLSLLQQINQGIDGVEGLRGSALGVLDAQDRHLYLPASTDSSIIIFERQAEGRLAFQDVIFDEEGSTIDGLRDIEVLHATRDGNDIYAFGAHHRVLTQFRRATDGRLQRRQIISLLELGFDESFTMRRLVATPSDSHLLVIDRFAGIWIFRRQDDGRLQFLHRHVFSETFPSSFVFEPRGRFLFAGSNTQLNVLELDPDSGTLTDLSATVVGEPNFEWMDIAPNGRFVYGARSGRFGPEVSMLRVYRWDAAARRLNEAAALTHPSFGDLLTGLMVTPDGRHLITSGRGSTEAGLTVFETDPDDGTVTAFQTLGPSAGDIGLEEPILGAMSASGNRLVAISNPTLFPITSTFFARDPSTGRLDILEQRTTGDSNGPSTIRDYSGLVWSPNGHQLYAFSIISDSLYAFDRSLQGGCTPGPSVLCLGNAGRFRVEVQWTDFVGGQGIGTKVVESGDSGLFWFFDDANWEMLVKVVDGCGFNGHHWVFAAATTNVAYTLTVTDTLRGVEAVYQNPLGVSSPAITDTEALDSCP